MGGCCVDDCKNSDKKGYQLFRIPANVRRKRIWLKFLKSKDESKSSKYISNNLRVCEVHFSELQFTIDANGTRKLKSNAVPDLLQQEIQTEDFLECELSPVEMEESQGKVNTPDINEEMSKKDQNTVTDCKCNENREMMKLSTLQAKLKAANRKYAHLEAKNRSLKNIFQNIFTEDQLMFLENNGNFKGFSWTDQTLTKAFRLYTACGSSGYEEILKQGLPFPSIRTIQRFMRNMKPEIALVILESELSS